MVGRRAPGVSPSVCESEFSTIRVAIDGPPIPFSCASCGNHSFLETSLTFLVCRYPSTCRSAHQPRDAYQRSVREPENRLREVAPALADDAGDDHEIKNESRDGEDKT